jgi:hypothetical protein
LYEKLQQKIINISRVDTQRYFDSDEVVNEKLLESSDDVIKVQFVKLRNGWHWFIDTIDKGVITKRDGSIICKISKILYDQIGCDWTPHKTFYQAIGWSEEEYFGVGNEPGRMQKQLSKLRNFLGVEIYFRKERGVSFPKNIVKSINKSQ